MAAADKLWFELGVRDEISKVLENLMRNSEKLAGMLTDDVVEMKNVYKNILDISNVYDKIYVTQKRISDLRGAKTLTADEKKGLQEMSKELENVRKEFAAILKNPDRATSRGEAQFEKTRLNIELMLKDTLRYVDNIEAKERAEAQNAINESKRIDDLKAKYYELQRYRKQLSDAIVGAAPNISIGGATKRLSQSLDYRMNQVSGALQNGGSMPNSAKGADFEKFLQDVKTKITELTSATNDYNNRLEANRQIQSALNKLSADATSQQKIAGIRKQTVEYAALGRKIQEIQALMQNVSNENGLLMSGRITSPTWTKEKVTEELNAIQRRYNEALAAGKQRELDDAAAKNQRANAAKKAADAVGMLAHVNEGLISSYNRIAEAGSKANRITIQLQNQIGAYAGLYGLERVLRSIVTIGGQFEVQHVALQNILGDVQETNILFGQLKELAIESPKTFMELTSYAKQLSAYQIPANELYDTTKRLADMSSGLGVDMNRLILAYGQVRSAAVLRGQELRQFTEAGIPMVQALADKFTELNGKLTTTADVFKLISARAVPFEMVKEVLWDMTSQGGQFFNMQEELANTLYGKWQKLQDSWQIMLGSIAEGTSASGFLFKQVLDFAVLLTQNLDKMVLALSALGAAKGIKYMAESLRNTTMKRSGEVAIENMRIAKIQEANRLERERVMYGRQLKTIEKELVMTKTTLNSREQALLVQSGAITSQQARQLIQDGKISRLAAYRLALEQGITKEKIRQMAASNNWSGLGATAEAAPMGKMGKWLGIGAKGALGFFGGWVGLAITAAGVAASVYSTIKESDERLNDLVNSISGSAEQNANQLAATLKNVGDSSDEPFKKVEALEEALIGMGNAGKQVVQDSRGFDDINERLENLVENAKAYQEALGAMGTPGGKSAIKGALDKSDLNDEMGDYEDLQNAEFKAQSALERYSSKYQQMIDALKTKHKELAEQLNGKNLYENLRLLMTGSYANEAFGYFAGNTPYGSAIRDYAKAVEESEEHLNNIKNNIIPDAMTDLKVLARQAGVDVSKSYEELTEAEKTKLRTIATNFANGLEKGSQDAKNSIASWVAQGFYTQLYITPVINTNELTGLPYELDQWQKGKGYGLWSKNDLKEANSDFIAFSKKQSQRKVDLEKKIKNYDKQLNGTVLDPDLIPTIKGQRQALQSELDQLNDSLKDGQWVFDKSLTKGQGKGGEKKDAALEALKNRVDLYKKFYSELENTTKIYGTGALDYLKANGFEEVFGWNLGDVTNYRQSLDELTKGFVLNTEARRKFANSVDADKVSNQRKADADAISKINSELKAQLSMLGEQYDTYKRIYQLTGNKEGAMNLAFGGGVQSATYKDELIRQMREALAAKPQGTLTAEDVFGMDKNTFAKTFGENSKIFSELYEAYAANEKKIKQETLQLLEETVSKNRTLAQQIDDENRRYERQLELIKQIKDPSLRQQAEQGAASEHNEKVAHLQLEQFKANSDWVKIFDDLDRVTTETLKDMMNATEQFGHTAGLSVEDVKALESAIAKMRNELANRNPFFAMSDAMSRMRTLSGYEKQADKQGNLIANQELSSILGVRLGSVVTKKDIKNGKRAAGSDFTKGVDGLKNKFDALAGALDPVIKLFDELGMKEVGQIFSAAQGALSGAAAGASAFSALGIAGPWGAVAGAGLSLLSSGISALFSGHDEALEEEIKASKSRQKEMENLTKNLETVLEHTLGSLYVAKADKDLTDKLREYGSKYEAREKAREDLRNGDNSLKNIVAASRNGYIQDRTYEAIKEAEQSKSYYDAQKAALMIQQDELRSQIASEEDKKDTDWDKVQDMNQQIKDLEMQIRYFAEEMAKDLYGIDYKSWAAGLADALVGAWASGENAVDAYKKKVSEMIKEVGTKIIAQKYLEPLLEKNMEEFLKYFEANDGRMDEQGLAILAKMYDDADQAARVTSAFLDGVEQIANRHGETIRDDSGSSASSSIKNITESTADLLASYINAIRADVSVNRATLMQLLTVVQGQSEMPIIARAQLEQLEQIARNTSKNANFAEDIYNLLHSLAPDGRSIKIK